MKLIEIAARLSTHIQRFCDTPEISHLDGRTRFWRGHAWVAGRFVGVRYIGYQGETFLPKADAEKYLAWLDAGNVGRHYAALEKS